MCARSLTTRDRRAATVASQGRGQDPQAAGAAQAPAGGPPRRPNVPRGPAWGPSVRDGAGAVIQGGGGSPASDRILSATLISLCSASAATERMVSMIITT